MATVTLTIELPTTIEVVSNGRKFAVDPSIWTDPSATIAEAVAYAFRVKTQRCTSQDKQTKEKQASLDACVTKLQSAEPHTAASGKGGGARLSALEKEIRLVLTDAFASYKGVNATEAKKLAMGTGRFVALTRKRLEAGLKKAGIDPETWFVDPNNATSIDNALEKTKTEIRATAQAKVDAAKASSNLNLEDLIS